MGCWHDTDTDGQFPLDAGNPANRVGPFLGSANFVLGGISMNYKHWLGVVVVLAIGYYMGKQGYLDPIISKVTGS